MGHELHSAGQSSVYLWHPKDKYPIISYWTSHLEISGVSKTYTRFHSFLQHKLSKKGSPSCSSTSRHELCIWLQTQEVSAVTGHAGRTQIFIQLHHGILAEAGNVKSQTLKLRHHNHSHHGKHHTQPRAAAKQRRLLLQGAHPPLQQLPNTHPGTGTTWQDAVGLVALTEDRLSFLLKSPSSIPRQSKVNDDE